MKRIKLAIALVVGLSISFVMNFYDSALASDTIYLDADSPETGSLLRTTPLITSYGTISFIGNIKTNTGFDPEFVAAGAYGKVFNICLDCDLYPEYEMYYERAMLSFDFDVNSVSFIYGGNMGIFDIEARDISGVVVDSFYQSDTYEGQPAGPITLSGTGIRSLYWKDLPYNTYAAIDNVTIEATPSVAPEPISSVLFLTGGATLIGRKYLRKRKKIEV